MLLVEHLKPEIGGIRMAIQGDCSAARTELKINDVYCYDMKFAMYFFSTSYLYKGTYFSLMLLNLPAYTNYLVICL